MDGNGKSRKVTQCEKVLRYLKENGSITPMEAVKHFNIYRLAARISDLKKKGFNIATVMEKSINAFGEPITYARYRLCS